MEEPQYQIYTHHYQLKRTSFANARTTDHIQHGALLKLEDVRDGAWGVADICPWPNLGDLSLAEEINQRGPLFQRAYELAKKDLQARRNQEKLVAAGAIKNHLLISDYKNFNLQELHPTIEIIKVKGDAHIDEVVNFLTKIEPSVQKIRLDFNFSLSECEFSTFIKNCSELILKKIDVIEDPFSFDSLSWKKCNQKVKLALDWPARDADQKLMTEQQLWPQRIYKPAREDVLQFEYITSSMDHPVGIAHALVYAQNYSDKTHGMQTLSLYERTDFHADFEIFKNNELIYYCQGHGIGFQNQLEKLSWLPLMNWKEVFTDSEAKNQIYLNPRFSPTERETLFELKRFFEFKIGNKGYVFIASSGSSQAADESVKLIALPFSALRNSAQRINSYYGLNEKMNWGCVLPTFHVGGLAIAIRAALANAKVYYCEWKEFSLDWLVENNIQLLSLVPAQAYDIVEKNWQAPQCLKHVFSGGAALNEETTRRMLELGWPLQITYGMTETASMIAVKKDPLTQAYTLFPGLQFNSDKALVCDSLAEHSVQKIYGQVKIQKLQSGDGYILPDDIEIIDFDPQSFILKGRKGDVIKILGEGVSLAELRDQLEAVMTGLSLNPLCATIISQSDKRKGQELILVLEPQVLNFQNEIVNRYNAKVRPYEKIQKIKEVRQIPRTSLGKIQFNLLIESINKAIY